MGPPIEVPAAADELAIETGRVTLEAALGRLREQALEAIQVE